MIHFSPINLILTSYLCELARNYKIMIKNSLILPLTKIYNGNVKITLDYKIFKLAKN